MKTILERIREKNPITRNHEVVRVDDYLTSALTKEAVDFIDRNREKPFFLYLAQNDPHVPLQAPKKYIDRYQNVQDPYKRVYAAMVSALDDSVGDVIAALRRDGLYENTLVIFLSDNGCAGYAYGACSNAPLSGFKRWQLEGGIRIPYIVSWPGHLSAGRVDNRQVSSLDILPTAAALADAKLPSDRVYDGVNLLPYLDGSDRTVPNPKLYWRNGPDFAMRDDNLKLWLADIAPQGAKSSDEPDEAGEGSGKGLIVPTVGREGQHLMLFDLQHDIGEKNNLAASWPRDVSRLKGEIEGWNKTLVKPMWPTEQAFHRRLRRRETAIVLLRPARSLAQAMQRNRCEREERNEYDRKTLQNGRDAECRNLDHCGVWRGAACMVHPRHVQAVAAATRPNIIVILADDLGYADISAYKIDRFHTPNIDRIGMQGVRFTDGYATAPVCGPSRAGLMTGRYQERFGFEYNNGPAQRDSAEGLGLAVGEITIAQLLKDAGYHTGMIGKWHLGSEHSSIP